MNKRSFPICITEFWLILKPNFLGYMFKNISVTMFKVKTIIIIIIIINIIIIIIILSSFIVKVGYMNKNITTDIINKSNWKYYLQGIHNILAV